MDGMFENIPKIALKEAEKGNKIIRIGAILEDYHYRTWYGKVLFKFHYIDLEKHMQDYINNHPVATHKIRLEKYTYKIVTGDWPRRNYYGFRICAEFCC